MSDSKSPSDTDEPTATWEEVKRRENEKRQTTKKFVLEYGDDIEAIFEFQMVENIGSIARKHTTKTQSRSGQEPEIRMTEDQEWAFAAELFQEAIVSAPEGFKPTEREIREGLTKPVVDEMVEAIKDFATLDEETRIKFR